MTTRIEEGWMPFGKFKTYYRIVGEHTALPPLVLLHGGPGSTHNYFELLDDLAAQSGRQLVMYDQLGCGRSSQPDNHPELYCAQTWVDELMALRDYLHLDQIHLLGQSWGGMLAIIYLCDYQPTGIASVILSSTLSSASLWAREQHRWISYMSPADQAAISQAESSGDYSTTAYQEANQHFMGRHASATPTADSPEPLRRPKSGGEVAYQTAWGPNEYTPLGNLKDYEYTDKLHQVTTPALVIDGTDDLCTPLVAKTMVDALPHAEWELFAGARHMVFAEQPAKYQRLLCRWLANHDE